MTRHELRPDVFGKPTAARPEEDPVNKEPPSPGLNAATSKDMLNAHILAQIVALEEDQHRAIREAMLGRSGASDYLAKLDAEMALLRTRLRS